MTYGTSAWNIAAVRRAFARWTSMKFRYLPWKRQKGCRALTTPAPWVQRLPAPAARAKAATSPVASAASPARRHSAADAPGEVQSTTSSLATSSTTVLAGRRFWASPIRPARKSARICSCNSGSKPFSASKLLRLVWARCSSAGRGRSAASNRSVDPASRGCVRHAAANWAISFRTAGLNVRTSCRSHSEAQIA